MSSVTDHLLVREIEARAARLEADEFVEFSYAGAPAAGHFCCVACGHAVTCVGLLPPCPGCGSRLWEDAATSPFAVSEPVPVPRDAYARWLDDDLDETAHALTGIWLAVSLGVIVWAFLAMAAAYVVTH